MDFSFEIRNWAGIHKHHMYYKLINIIIVEMVADCHETNAPVKSKHMHT